MMSVLNSQHAKNRRLLWIFVLVVSLEWATSQCTPDVFECPDGSIVVRVPPECEFQACPDAGVCTQDVFECPDGSFVSRIPPDCEFEDCPVTTPCTSDAFVCPDGTTVGRVPPECDFAECPAPSICSLDVRICPDGVTEVIRDPNNNCEFEPCPDGCSSDEFECPDGTIVGRIPPECEFAECPPLACNLDTLECPDGSFVGRVEPDCEFEACPTPAPVTPAPTKKPTASPTKKPTASPTKKPTAAPTKKPTPAPVTPAPITGPPTTSRPTTQPPITAAPVPPPQNYFFTLAAAAGGCLARKTKGSGGDELFLKACSSDDENIQWRLDSMGRFRSKANDVECMQVEEYPAQLSGVEVLAHGSPLYAKDCGGALKDPFQMMQVPALFGAKGGSVTSPVKLAARPDLCVVHFAADPTVGESRIMLTNCTALGGGRGRGWTAEDPCMHVPYCDDF